MKILALIPTPPQSRDLTDALVRSLAHWAPSIVPLVLPTRGVRATEHGQALDDAKPLVAGSDLVVLLDNDTLVLSPLWEALMTEAFHDPSVEAWGLAWEGRLHPLCLAVRTPIFTAMSTWQAHPSGWDTGVQAIQRLGRTVTAPFVLAPRGKGEPATWLTQHSGEPVFTHLGGGSGERTTEATRAHFIASWPPVLA